MVLVSLVNVSPQVSCSGTELIYRWPILGQRCLCGFHEPWKWIAFLWSPVITDIFSTLMAYFFL